MKRLRWLQKSFTKFDKRPAMKSQVKNSKKFIFLIDGKKGNLNNAPGWVHFFKSIDIGILTSKLRLNSTSAVSICQMILTSLPAQYKP